MRKKKRIYTSRPNVTAARIGLRPRDRARLQNLIYKRWKQGWKHRTIAKELAGRWPELDVDRLYVAQILYLMRLAPKTRWPGLRAGLWRHGKV